MHLLHLQIANVRSFRGVDVDLTHQGRAAGWTVIAGRNGSGKTTLLQAIAVGLMGSDGIDALLGTLGAWVRADAVEARVVCTLTTSIEHDAVPPLEQLQPGYESELSVEAVQREETSLLALTPPSTLSYAWIWRNAQTSGSEWTGRRFDNRGADWLGLTLDRCLTHGSSRGWFACGYGAFRRRFGHAETPAAALVGLRKATAFATLFREDQALVECVLWLQRMHVRAIDKADAEAARLRDGAIRLLNDGLLPDGVALSRVDSEALWTRSEGVERPFDHLPSGFRVVASIVLDILTQMHAAYGTLSFEERDGRVVVPHGGVVLIDEAEEHLHPSWQQRLGFWLTAHFPGVQFLVTTHSPFIAQAADALIRLHRDAEGSWTASRASAETHAAVVHGALDVAVLSDLFGLEHLHSERTEALLARVALLEVRAMRGIASAEERAELAAATTELPRDDVSALERSARRVDAIQARP